MSDYLSRVVEQSMGIAASVQPLVAPMFAPPSISSFTSLEDMMQRSPVNVTEEQLTASQPAVQPLQREQVQPTHLPHPIYERDGQRGIVGAGVDVHRMQQIGADVHRMQQIGAGVHRMQQIGADGRPQGFPPHRHIGADGRPQGFPPHRADGRPQGFPPPIPTAPAPTIDERDDQRGIVGAEADVHRMQQIGADGRPQGFPPHRHIGADGRPQGSPPPIPTAPAPTIDERDDQRGIVGAEADVHRMQQIGADVHRMQQIGVDGRPQGSPPPIPTAPAPTIDERDDQRGIVGAGADVHRIQQIGADGRPQGFPPHRADGRPQGSPPPIPTAPAPTIDERDDQRGIVGAEVDVHRMQQIGADVHRMQQIGVDGRPQGSPPPIPTAPAPTIDERDDQRGIVGAGVDVVVGRGPLCSPVRFPNEEGLESVSASVSGQTGILSGAKNDRVSPLESVSPPMSEQTESLAPVAPTPGGQEMNVAAKTGEAAVPGDIPAPRKQPSQASHPLDALLQQQSVLYPAPGEISLSEGQTGKENRRYAIEAAGSERVVGAGLNDGEETLFQQNAWRQSLARDYDRNPAPEPGAEQRLLTEANQRNDGANEPVIRVSIGRVEVRATTSPPAPVTKRAAPAAPALSLSDYLQRRKGGSG